MNAVRARFCRNLRLVRRALDVSVQDMVVRMGMKRSTYNSYELGLSEPSLETLVAIQNALCVRVDLLLNTELDGLTLLQVRALVHRTAPAGTNYAPPPTV